jgi:hypothetical protein
MTRLVRAAIRQCRRRQAAALDASEAGALANDVVSTRIADSLDLDTAIGVPPGVGRCRD